MSYENTAPWAESCCGSRLVQIHGRTAMQKGGCRPGIVGCYSGEIFAAGASEVMRQELRKIRDDVTRFNSTSPRL